uniref:non-specific serine/threonine protein kinase n=1 Tax=Gadus morhua TaxID=8049 RepID=A0A8C5AWJ5_GADMO
MSLALHDLLVCCKGLDNDKATERKKEAERFRRLLKDPETVQELDRTSGPKAAKGSKQLSWDSVFRFLQRYVQKETEHLQSSKATVSDTTIATRLKKMAEMCSLVKYFIRCANKRGPRLQFKELLRHVMEVLQSSYSCSAYGEEYSSLLVKDVLSVRKYWCDVTTQQWQNLLELFCGLFNSSSTAINRVLVSRVISTVVQGCCIQTDGLHSTLFRFFSKALLNVRQEKHLPVVEHLVSALNIFLRSAAMNCRMRVCGLGEELLPSVLYVWADMRPSSALKDEMVDFFNLQLCVHHPNGAKTPETGAHAEDWNRWRSLLYNLYNELVSEISHIGSRGKYISGTRHIAVKDNLIELTADICHQLFTGDVGVQVLEVTQLPARSRAGATEGTPSKRRRIELGWEVLREHLQPQHSDFDIIPWLQITTVLLSKYRSTVPGGELVPLLSVLCQLLGEQRRGERGAYVLGCLRELAPCPAAHPDRAPESRAELDRLWGRVWTLALRAVGSPQSEALSLGLLTSIIRAGLMSMDRESWKLFSGMACKPSQSAAVCLAQALLKCAVPKRLVRGSDVDGFGSQSLKEALVGWLLMSDQSDESDDSVKPYPIILAPGLSQSPTTAPECLVRCLTLLTGVLAGYVSTGALSQEEAFKSPLFIKAKVPYGGPQLEENGMVRGLIPTGAQPLLAEEHLASEDLALLASLEFLCVCASVQPAHSLLFKPQEVRRKLLQLLEHVDFSRALHVNMVGKKVAADTHAYGISPCTTVSPCFCVLRDLCSLYRQDQEVCATVLLGLLPAIQCLGQTHHPASEMRHVQGMLLQVISGFCILAQTGKCTAGVRAGLVKCLVALLEADPCCEWAVLDLKEEELPVSVLLPSHLADAHHHVRMLAAMSVERLFVEMKAGQPERRMLPLHHQQEAFERVYLKAQEGMRFSQSAPSEELRDEAFNRKASLLKCVSVVLCCSPVCEKQALFALFQSHKENNIEDQLIKKVLCSVSRALGYRSVKGFVSSHLYYLVAEWLGLRQADDRYNLESFPFALLGHDTLHDFYSASFQVLIPHLVYLEDFELVRSIGGLLGKDWRELLADCFPRIMVNILPYFVLSGQDPQVALQRGRATKVYDLLKDSSCLGKQRIDSLIQSNLAHIVVELLLTLYEGAGTGEQEGADLQRFIGELDPAPNPPYFSSHVIKATLDYISRCHGANHKSLVAILSKNPISIQRILLALCEKAVATTNGYERHRILLMYHLLVGLLLGEMEEGLGGAWAFVLRDIIYTLIHHFNSRWGSHHCDEVSTRSLLLCCDLLAAVCRAALQFCPDALECHLQVILGTLTAQVTSRPAISQQVLSLLRFLVVENQEKLRSAICRLEPFPDGPGEFKELRSVQHELKYSSGTFTLRQEIEHFLSVTSCDTLPLTRLEGLKELSRQLRQNKAAIRELLKECHGEEQSVLVKLILSLLHLCKVAANHPGGAHILEAAGSCLGELGPIDLSTIALLHGRDPLYTRAVTLFPSSHAQGLYILLDCMNHALTHHSIEVKKAAGQCVKSILGTQSGADFWEQHKDKQDPMLAYLNPFRTAKKKVPPQVGPEESKELLESQGLWVPQTGAHKRWLKTLCAALLDSGGVRNHVLLLSRPLCLVRADFCQRALPLVVHSILQGDRDGSWRLLLSRHVQDFFTSCCRSSQASGRSATPLPVESDSDMVIQGSLDKASLRTMLSVVDYLRHQQRPVDTDGAVGDTNSWLELNFLEVARAAQACSAHFTALLYSEIYVDKIKASTEESRRINFEENSQTFTISNLTQKSMEDNGISLQELLMEVYRCIGEPDSLYGCGGEKMSSPLTRIRTYEHEAMWGKALSSYDLHSSLPEVTRQVGIQALQNFGLSGILATYLRGLDSEGVEWGSELRELRFQAAWRSTQWDCDLPGFNESVFGALLALNDKEFSMFDRTLKYARGAEVEELCRGSLEAVSSLYPAVRNLQSLGELQSVRQLFSRPLSDTTLAEVCRQWGQHSQLLADSDFPLVEPILALRSATMQTLLARAGDPDSTLFLSSVLTNHLMELCQLARNAGNTQLAERAVYQMKQLASGAARTAAASSSWQLEEAQVFWAKGEQGPALGLLKEMINTLEGQVDMNPALVPVYTESMRLCGNWLAESCLESPGVILEKYLERAVEVLQANSGEQDPRLQSQRTKAFLSLARFSDFQYQTIEKYMRSSAFENKQVLLEKAKAEVDLMKEHNVDSNRYTVKLEKELKMDELALSNLQGDRRRFLCKAVDNYVHCLAEGEQHDDWVFRLASLWLENADLREVNAMMKVGVKRIPSHKFLPLMYQLAARMGTKMSTDSAEDVGFHDVLNDLILRACLQHPHHTLFIILALVNANKDASFTSKSRLSKNTPQQPSPLDLERSEVARKIISVVRKKRGAMLKGMEYLCDAYITLAYMDASRHKQEKKPLPIPADQPIMKIQDLEEVTIPTVEIRVDPSGCYDNVVTIRSFKPQYRLVGGVNLPKIIDCVGSDGRSHRQLVKGQDDLRQDAVMQQVFSMCSTLLQRNAETRRRKLHIRRYKVVPFSQRSGVLEWCSGTVPIGEFLVDPQKGAHGRFRPRDWTNLACRKKMMVSLTAYSEVCRHFRPVFRHFCMERFLDPAVWMEKRLAYTRSVATSSIVGYIVGLGDRHIQNILIDEQTAELIHIDLGVAFEQGKILPTPETVPFRLTRDMVDGMGITGVEGVFRRCCEKTMEVMRTSQEAVLTIVEVLLYDPLFDWTMNPLKAFQLQHVEQQELNATLQPTLGADDMDHHAKGSSDSQSFNKVAERVLLRLQDKLKGVEEGAVLSVGGQVNLLIQQAMDPSNLSRLFSGWQAWV